MKISTISTVVFAVTVGGVMGWTLKPAPEAVTVKSEETREESLSQKPIADVGQEAMIKALRQKVVDLERKLAARDKDSSEEKTEGTKNERPNVFDFKAHAERMKKENPEMFASMTNSVARWRRQRLDRAQSKLDFFSSLDTSTMSRKARESQEKLQDLIAKREEIEDALQNMDISPEERREYFDQLLKNNEETEKLNGVVREQLFTETLKSLGVGSEDAKVANETFKEIIDMTDSGMRWTRPHRRNRR